MIILLHTSKTMRPATTIPEDLPLLLHDAETLVDHVRKLSVQDIMHVMHVSETLAAKTKEQFEVWRPRLKGSAPAIEAFVGDIYSGLQAQSFTKQDREYAQQHLRILSGLYGILRPNDGVYPYRFEMGYTFKVANYKNPYEFWGKKLAKTISPEQIVVDVTAVEYSKAILPHLSNTVVTPRFLTINSKTHEPTFVVVHAKIARGAFARWMIQNRITKISQLKDFNELGYQFDATTSTELEPVFVCQEFGGKGLSVRLT